MNIRKVVYSIEFYHILTFKDYYREIIGPYFVYDNLQYSIENENTINETIKLIFRAEGILLQFRKEAATIIYEGKISDFKKKNPIVDIYLDIIEKIKSMSGFTKIIRHKINLICVDTMPNEEVDSLLKVPKFLFNPFGQLTEFATSYEFEIDGKKIKFDFGNYRYTDLAKNDISPFKTDYNFDLVPEIEGVMSKLEVIELISSNSLTKLRNLLEFGEGIIKKYLQ